MTPDDQIFAVLEALKPEAQALTDKTTRSLAGSYRLILQRYVAEYLAGTGAIVDARVRKWAISFDFGRYKPNTRTGGIPIYQTPHRRNKGDGHQLMGQWVECVGLDAAANLIEAKCVELGAPFTAEGLRAAFKNIRGPVSRGGGRAEMRRLEQGIWVRTLPDRTTRETIVTWWLNVTVCRLELAPKRRSVFISAEPSDDESDAAS